MSAVHSIFTTSNSLRRAGFAADRPIPPLAAYEAWLDANRSDNPRGHGRKNEMTAVRLHRIAAMRRSGCSWREVGEAIGYNAQAACSFFNRLPPELRP